MPSMVDPTNALMSFQEAFLRGGIPVQPCEVDDNLFVHFDEPIPGQWRCTYALVNKKSVEALAVYGPTDPYEGVMCVYTGYAVPPGLRNRGLAKSIVKLSLAELSACLGRNGFSEFYVEAVVGVDNIASQKVAAATLSQERQRSEDEHSGVAAFQYLKLVTCKQAVAS